jgi:molybdopterin molybdotransferase
MVMVLDRKSRFSRRAIKVIEGQNRIKKYIKLLPSELVSILNVKNRRIAEDVYASENVPHFRRSGLDGYAINSVDVHDPSPTNPTILEIVTDIQAGDWEDEELLPQTAARIMTGSAVPPGASAVVMFEQTEEYVENGKNYVRIKHPVVEGQNIAIPGDEIKQGQLIIKKGTSIQPGQIALLSTFGFDMVPVYKRPNVAIIATGSELLDITAPLVPGRIRNSNSYMLASLVEHAGGIPQHYGIIPDEIDEARTFLQEVASKCDLIITSGGVSVGDFDIMADIFKELQNKEDNQDNQEENKNSYSLLFNKVAMRPGSPTTVALFQDQFLFGLSGNPGACFVGFELFVKPVLLGMQGHSQPFIQPMMAFLAEDFSKGSPHERYERGKIYFEDGLIFAVSSGANKSSMMVSIQGSNGLIIIPPGKKGLSKGDKVQFLPLAYEVSPS